MTADRFWKFFWIGSGGITVLGLAVALGLFVSNTRQGDLLAAIGVTYQEGKDPFEGSTFTAIGGSISLNSGYLYQNSLPLHFKSWTWEATADWRNAEEKQEGSYALKSTYAKPGGTVGMNGPNVNIRDMRSISLYVHTDTGVSDILIDLYDKTGAALKEQSVGWYTQSGALTPNTWEKVVIPLQNFSDGAAVTDISGFSISGKYPGIAYIDAVQLSKTPAEHTLWVAPPEAEPQAFNPFATSTPAALPYNFSPTPDSLVRWYSYFGSFGPGKSGMIEMGPSEAAKTTGSMTVFRGGRNWSSYHVDSTINWGQVSVYSLLARFVDDGNFVSCAFSRYGEGVQIYHMRGGISEYVSQTPPLPVKDFEPWANVNVGIEVKDNRVKCFVDGEEVLAATLPTMSQTGSVGFETWDPNPAAAPHQLTKFTVEASASE